MGAVLLVLWSAIPAAGPSVTVMPVEVHGAPPWRAPALQRGLEVAAVRSGAFSSVLPAGQKADLLLKGTLERQSVGYALALRLETPGGAVHARVVWPACNSDWRVTHEAVVALTVQAGLRPGPAPAVPVCGTTPGQKSGWLALGLATSGVGSMLLGAVALGAGVLAYVSITRPDQLSRFGWPLAVEGLDAQQARGPSVAMMVLGGTALGLGGVVVLVSLGLGAAAWMSGI